MDTIGIDLHKRESQVCMLTDDGELFERRIATTRERLTSVVGGRPRSRVLLTRWRSPAARMAGRQCNVWLGGRRQRSHSLSSTVNGRRQLGWR